MGVSNALKCLPTVGRSWYKLELLSVPGPKEFGIVPSAWSDFFVPNATKIEEFNGESVENAFRGKKAPDQARFRKSEAKEERTPSLVEPAQV